MDPTNDFLPSKFIPKPIGELQPPPGFVAPGKTDLIDRKKPTDEQLEELKTKKAWEVALAPAKSIPMNLIMSYMTGNSLQVIPITMTLMLLWTPLQAIFTQTNVAFAPYSTGKNGTAILSAKIAFIVFQLLSMSVGVWKLDKMGLIPNRESDWIAWVPVSEYLEYLV